MMSLAQVEGYKRVLIKYSNVFGLLGLKRPGYRNTKPESLRSPAVQGEILFAEIALHGY